MRELKRYHRYKINICPHIIMKIFGNNVWIMPNIYSENSSNRPMCLSDSLTHTMYTLVIWCKQTLELGGYNEQCLCNHCDSKIVHWQEAAPPETTNYSFISTQNTPKKTTEKVHTKSHHIVCVSKRPLSSCLHCMRFGVEGRWGWRWAEVEVGMRLEQRLWIGLQPLQRRSDPGEAAA